LGTRDVDMSPRDDVDLSPRMMTWVPGMMSE
jgi:hypothetical protein